MKASNEKPQTKDPNENFKASNENAPKRLQALHK